MVFRKIGEAWEVKKKKVLWKMARCGCEIVAVKRQVQVVGWGEGGLCIKTNDPFHVVTLIFHPSSGQQNFNPQERTSWP